MPSQSKRGGRNRHRRVVAPLREGGTNMADRESRSSMMSQSYADLTTPWRTGMKEMVARYVDTSEKLAKGALDFQERATAWAKGTPWRSEERRVGKECRSGWGACESIKKRT